MALGPMMRTLADTEATIADNKAKIMELQREVDEMLNHPLLRCAGWFMREPLSDAARIPTVDLRAYCDAGASP